MNRKELGLAGKDEAAIPVVSRIERIVDQSLRSPLFKDFTQTCARFQSGVIVV
jgi:hypothetical protein